jgi:hypothetical protein
VVILITIKALSNFLVIASIAKRHLFYHEKTARIDIRFTPEQKQDILFKAKLFGFRNPVDYIRTIVQYNQVKKFDMQPVVALGENPWNIEREIRTMLRIKSVSGDTGDVSSLEKELLSYIKHIESMYAKILRKLKNGNS